MRMPFLRAMDTSEREDQKAETLVAAAFWAVVLTGWFVWLVILGVLLSQDNTLIVNGLCGNLWQFMLVRTILWGFEWLQAVFTASGLENWVRALAGLEHIESHHEGGCFALLLGSSALLRWVGTLLHFVYNASLAVFAVVVVPSAVIDNAPCCVNALAASSFTGTYTLATFGWVFLVIDCMQAAARGVWLVMRHGEVYQRLHQQTP
jgi:hypothetical protein